MSLSKRIYGGVGWVIGGTANVALKGCGIAASLLTKDQKAADERFAAWSNAGTVVHNGATKTGEFVGSTLATVSQHAGKLGGTVAQSAATMAGADQATAEKWGKVGSVVAAAGIGFAVGEVVTGCTIGAIGALDGLSGAAAVAHGERVIGSLIGGGQVAGKVITSSVEAASAVTTSADRNRKL